MKFVIDKNLASKPAWWLVDDDDRVLAWAGRTFFSLGAADEAAHEFRVGPDDPDYRVYEESGGTWRWAAWQTATNRVAVSGQTFLSKRKAVHAALAVRQQASTALGP